MGEQVKEPSSTNSVAHNRISKAQRTGYLLIIVGSCINLFYLLENRGILYFFVRSWYDDHSTGDITYVFELVFRLGLLAVMLGMVIVAINANNRPKLWRLLLAISGLPHILVSLYILAILIYVYVKFGWFPVTYLENFTGKSISLWWDWWELKGMSIFFAYLSLPIMAAFIAVKEKRRFQIIYAVAAGMLWLGWPLRTEFGQPFAPLWYLVFIACSIYFILKPIIPRVPYSDFRS